MIFSPVSAPPSPSSMASVADLPHFHCPFPLAIEKVHPRICNHSLSPRPPKPDFPGTRICATLVASNFPSASSRDTDDRRPPDGVSQSDRSCSFPFGPPRSKSSRPDLFSVIPKSCTSGEAVAREQDRRLLHFVFRPRAGGSIANCGEETFPTIDELSLSLSVSGLFGQVRVEEALNSLLKSLFNREFWLTKLTSQLFNNTGSAHGVLMQKLELLLAFLDHMFSFGFRGPWEIAQAAACPIGCSCTPEPQFSAPTFLQSTSFDVSPTGNRWEDKARIRRMMEERGIKKEPGMSRIEINGKLHSFVANDRNHPQLKEIHKEIDRIHKEMREAGYDPDTRFVLHDLPEAEKAKAIQFHSERLAMALGFISTPPRTALRIVKNLRICGDCHTATKYMSKLTQREIIMRDAFRFHHFKNGVCSCGDYW